MYNNGVTIKSRRTGNVVNSQQCVSQTVTSAYNFVAQERVHQLEGPMVHSDHMQKRSKFPNKMEHTVHLFFPITYHPPLMPLNFFFFTNNMLQRKEKSRLISVLFTSPAFILRCGCIFSMLQGRLRAVNLFQGWRVRNFVNVYAFFHAETK